MGRTGDCSRDRRKLADAKRPIKRLLFARGKIVMRVSSVSGNALHQYHALFASLNSRLATHSNTSTPYCADSVFQTTHTSMSIMAIEVSMPQPAAREHPPRPDGREIPAARPQSDHTLDLPLQMHFMQSARNDLWERWGHIIAAKNKRLDKVRRGR